MITPDTGDRIKELLSLFKLPTMASECVRRFRDAGHDEALAVLLETLEAEQGERRVRRCDRLLRGSKLLRRTRDDVIGTGSAPAV